MLDSGFGDGGTGRRAGHGPLARSVAPRDAARAEKRALREFGPGTKRTFAGHGTIRTPGSRALGGSRRPPRSGAGTASSQRRSKVQKARLLSSRKRQQTRGSSR